MDEPGNAIEEGRAALARGAWAEARLRFREALAQAETPEAYEGAGLAARYELDAEAAIEAHERGTGGVTRLTVVHDLEGAPNLATMVSGGMEDTGAGGGWSWILSDLKTLLETGSSMEWQPGQKQD